MAPPRTAKCARCSLPSPGDKSWRSAIPRRFAWRGSRLQGRVGLALPSLASYRTAHSKAGFSRLLDQLGLPQPPTQIATSESELRGAIEFPSVVKTSVGTASRGIRFVRNDDDLESALHDLNAICRRKLIGFHACRQIAAGAGEVRGGWGSRLLDIASIRRIESEGLGSD